MIDDRKTSINQGDLVMKTCKETALSWGIPERTVNYMCNTGKINGAVKVGKSWQIPDTEKRAGKGDAVMLKCDHAKKPA